MDRLIGLILPAGDRLLARRSGQRPLRTDLNPPMEPARRRLTDITALAPGLAALGPYFAIETHDPVAPIRPCPWVPLIDLITSSGPAETPGPGGQGGAGRAAGRKPEDVELRAAASVAQLGLAARMLGHR